MGSYQKHIWEQLKNKTADDLISALLKDGFLPDEEFRTERIYRHPDGRKVSIHYHKGSQTYGAKLMKGLLDVTKWTEKKMRQLKLVK
jgi:predicted RNA binding protein YcfA (HicA-like mRNA interferase family)